MGDYRPTEQQLLEIINESLKKTNNLLQRIFDALLFLIIIVGGYIWKRGGGKFATGAGHDGRGRTVENCT